jgi:hypothetical protein
VKEELSFTEEEHKEIGLEKIPIPGAKGQFDFRWNPEKVKDKYVYIGPVMMEVILEALNSLDRGKQLNELTFPLYERFVINSAKTEPVCTKP